MRRLANVDNKLLVALEILFLEAWELSFHSFEDGRGANSQKQ